MTEPDEALIWAQRHKSFGPSMHATLAHAYRAGQAASAERIKALEEALERIDDLFADAVQFDCENGVRSLNEAATARYLADAPATKAAIHESLEIIRAQLKEADQ